MTKVLPSKAILAHEMYGLPLEGERQLRSILASVTMHYSIGDGQDAAHASAAFYSKGCLRNHNALACQVSLLSLRILAHVKPIHLIRFDELRNLPTLSHHLTASGPVEGSPVPS